MFATFVSRMGEFLGRSLVANHLQKICVVMKSQLTVY